MTVAMANGISSAFSLDNVLLLLDEIKNAFAGQPQKFNSFKDVLMQYLKNEIETAEVLNRLRILFYGHSELTSAFNCLLPPRLKLEDDRQFLLAQPKRETNGSEQPSWNDDTKYSRTSCDGDFEADDVIGCPENAGIKHSLNLIGKVQKAYKDRPEVFQQFLQVLQGYLTNSELNHQDADGRLMMENTLQELEALFCDDVELFTELKDFVLGICEEEQSSNNRDNSTVDIIKYGTYEEFTFFDEVWRQMGNEETYLNFMRCLQLFTCNLISGSELLEIIEPFVVKSPGLMRQLKEMVKHGNDGFESVSQKALSYRKTQHPHVSMEIDYSSCKRKGVSYRALPDSFERPVCSARTELCHEVLNDTWVSFPLWSEDTTFGNSKITAYQEFLYRCEDERFELQIVIDSVSSTIKILEDLCEKMDEMSPEQQANFKLDDRLGGTSEVLQKKSIQRIYGDRANQIIDGLKENPFIAVPIALRRLKAKTQEWKEHQERFNKSWKELNVKNYQKSLCNDASTFKQNDQKDMKTKNLLQEAEAIFYENQAQASQHIRKVKGQQFVYTDKRILYNVSVLLSHFLSHLPTVQNDDGFLISRLLTEFLPSLLYIPGSEFSDGLSEKKEEMGSEMEEEAYTLMYTTSDWYLFVRLHYKLYERLLEIRTRCRQMQKLDLIHSDLTTPDGRRASNPYEYVLLMTECLIEGTIENSAYEDQHRVVFESSASSMFALDRLLQNIMKQLQHITSDELNKDLMALFENEKSLGGTGGHLSTSRQRSLQEMSYWHKAYEMINNDCYKIVFYKYKGMVTMELMYRERPNVDDFEEVKQWTEYIDQYATSESVEMSLVQKQLFLERNLQRDREQALIRHSEGEASPIVAIDNMQCQFSANSLKMVYIGSSRDFFRFRPTAKRLSSQAKSRAFKHTKFLKWLNAWKHSNVTNEQERRFRDWMTGQKSGRVRGRQHYDPHSIMPHRQCKKFYGQKRN